MIIIEEEASRDARFCAAMDSVINFHNRERTGIGMQKEKSLHAILKNYMDPDPSHQEIPVGPFIADICDEQAGRIVEVQTANLGAMRQKLSAFLPDWQVTVLHPIPHRKTITWIDPKTGELLKSNPSRTTGSFYEIFRELYKIDAFLSDPNLTVMPVLIDLTEYRLQDGWSRDGKRGSHRFERMPEGIYDELILRTPEDYAVFLPADKDALPDPFTAKEFEEAVGIHRKSLQYATVLRILTELGVVERVGQTARRAWQYHIRIQNLTQKDYCRTKKGSRK